MFVRYILHQDEVFKIYPRNQGKLECQNIPTGRISEEGSVNSDEEVGVELVNDADDSSTGEVAPNASKVRRTISLCAILSLGYTLIILLPLASVNDGARSNWPLIYFIVPFCGVLGLAPYVSTFEYVILGSKILLKDECASVFAGTLSISFVYAFVTEDWGPFHMFPFPFTTYIFGAMVGLPPTMITLYLLGRRRGEVDENYLRKFVKYIHVMSVFVCSVLIPIAWACVMTALEINRFGQFCWSLMYGPFKYLCKLIIFAPILTHVSPKNWIIVTMVVEIFFARFQTLVFPFINSYWSLFALLSESAVLPAWKFYGGSDRLKMIMHYLKGLIMNDEKARTLRESLNDPQGIMRASLKMLYIADMTMNNDSSFADDNDRNDSIVSSRSRSLSHSSSKNAGQVFHNRSPTASEECPGVDIITTSSSDDTIFSDPSNNIEIYESPNEEDKSFQDIRPDRLRCCGWICSRGDDLKETCWEQRLLFWVVDSVGAESITIIVRFQYIISTLFLYFGPNKDNLNETFRQQSPNSVVMAVAAFLIDLTIFNLYTVFFQRVKLNGDRPIDINAVLSYIYNGNSLFLGTWLGATGMFVVTAMINHFGVDFSLKFEW
eukprot:CAMPEP_0116021026 /NCGR_PEP_ID=MMETSP0321-20121206/10143_1 /TAXON_ID=163516 /ORGANISM="Leptocylindrus danicus var. danicus, Strain B650" /LENGTH=605 /DNA_ID=CAMNT_0003491821 /DNA_START=116 /DNA_END=1930 /DNA_ORIENTATION=+